MWPFREFVGGLTPGTTYYYRVCGRDFSLYPAVCAKTEQFTTASSPTFTPHLFAASGQVTPGLDDIIQIGSRLYVSGGPCAAYPESCALVGSLALNGAEEQVEFPQDAPSAITRGPDGDPWVLTVGDNLDTGGALTHFGLDLETFPGYADLGRSSPAAGVTVADGALWVVTNRGELEVSAWSTDGTPIVGRGANLTDIDPNVSGGAGITTGPDGALWVTTFSKIWRIATEGRSVTEFPLAPGTAPRAITAGPDGALWFTTQGKIGRLTTAGNVRYFTVPSQPNVTPGDITEGPDGALWFTEGSANKLGRITPDGQITEYPVSALPNGHPKAITAGPDGALWFTDNRSDGAYIVRAG